MASSYSIVGSDGSTIVYLVNSSGIPTPGGDPTSAATTPFGIRSHWTPTAAKRLDSYVDETIPLVYIGSSVDGALDDLDLLRNLVDDPTTGQASFVCQPNGASSPISYGIYWIDVVQESGWEGTSTSPGEGATRYFIDLTLRRTAQPGGTIFEDLLG